MKLPMLCGSAMVIGTLMMLSSSAFAQDDDAQRAKLNGSWQGADQAVWTIQEQGGGMHLTNSQGEKKIAEFVCDFAKECEGKDAGKKVKVTLYFNGPKLVVMERRGDDFAVKRRFGFGQAADKMEMETMPVTPAGQTQTVTFTRVPTAAAK